jgi:hypothetical protein
MGPFLLKTVVHPLSFAASSTTLSVVSSWTSSTARAEGASQTSGLWDVGKSFSARFDLVQAKLLLRCHRPQVFVRCNHVSNLLREHERLLLLLLLLSILPLPLTLILLLLLVRVLVLPALPPLLPHSASVAALICSSVRYKPASTLLAHFLAF